MEEEEEEEDEEEEEEEVAAITCLKSMLLYTPHKLFNNASSFESALVMMFRNLRTRWPSSDVSMATF